MAISSPTADPMNTDDRALADRLRALYAEVATLWGFTIPEGPVDGINAAAIEAMMRGVKEDRADRLEAFHAKPAASDVEVVRAVLHAHQRAMTPPDSGWGNMSYLKGSYDDLPVFQAALATYRAALQSPPPVVSEEAIGLGRVVLEGRGDGTYAEAERAIKALIDALEHSQDSESFGSSDEARAISNGVRPGAAQMEAPKCFGCDDTAFTAESYPCPVCQPEPVVEEGRREAETIARIIDPDAWHPLVKDDGCGAHWHGRRAKALAKADAILALTPVEGVGMREALERIANWEMPETGQFWDKERTQPMSYGACYGSNGERDHIISIAKAALSTPATAQGAVREALTEPQSTNLGDDQ